MPPETSGPGVSSDPPALAASVVGAVRTEKPWAVNVKPTPEQFAAWLKACTDEERVDVAGKMLDAQDRAARCFEMDHYRNGERVGELLALVDELTAQRDLARDAAVALEQENTRLSERLRPPRDDGMGGAVHPMDDPYKRAEASPAAVLGLGLQPETSEQ